MSSCLALSNSTAWLRTAGWKCAQNPSQPLGSRRTILNHGHNYIFQSGVFGLFENPLTTRANTSSLKNLPFPSPIFSSMHRPRGGALSGTRRLESKDFDELLTARRWQRGAPESYGSCMTSRTPSADVPRAPGTAMGVLKHLPSLELPSDGAPQTPLGFRGRSGLYCPNACVPWSSRTSQGPVTVFPNFTTYWHAIRPTSLSAP